MVKAKKGGQFTASELPADKRKELLSKMGRMIKAAREERTTLEKFAHEAKISKTQLIKHEAGGDMLLSTFWKLLYALDITPEEFFRELEKKDK